MAQATDHPDLSKDTELKPTAPAVELKASELRGKSPVAAEELARITHQEIMEQAGAEAVELIMWLTMRGAVAPRARRVHRHYYAPMTTGMGLITFEE